MQLATNHAGTGAARAEALFASVLQRSGRPSPGQVRKAVAAAVRAYGARGCAAVVAQEFGDHPETAVQRMRWARAVAGEVFARRRPAGTAAGQDMKRVQAGGPRIRRERPWPEDLLADPP